MRRLTWSALVTSAVLLMGLAYAPTAGLAEEPQRGGILKVSLSGDPPSLDMHQEQTFLVDDSHVHGLQHAGRVRPARISQHHRRLGEVVGAIRRRQNVDI